MKTIIYLLILITPSALQAQQPNVSPQVVSTAGGYVEGTGLSLSYTIGEVAVQTLTAGSLMLTEGFQQPLDIGTFNRETMQYDWDIKTWPNPVAQDLYLKVGAEIQQDLVLEATDLSGRIHMIQKIEPPLRDAPFKVDLSHLAGGVYLLKIRTADHSLQRMVKILKE